MYYVQQLGTYLYSTKHEKLVQCILLVSRKTAPSKVYTALCIDKESQLI